jgi:hypothetical protein
MMGKKKLSEIKAELAALLEQLPGGPKVWFDREIESARGDSKRDVETLEALRAALDPEAGKKRKPKTRKKRATKG